MVHIVPLGPCGRTSIRTLGKGRHYPGPVTLHNTVYILQRIMSKVYNNPCYRVSKSCNQTITWLHKIYENLCLFKQWTPNRKPGSNFVYLSQFDKVVSSFTCFYVILPHISAQFCQSEQFDCASEFAFRKPARVLYRQSTGPWGVGPISAIPTVSIVMCQTNIFQHLARIWYFTLISTNINKLFFLLLIFLYIFYSLIWPFG